MARIVVAAMAIPKGARRVRRVAHLARVAVLAAAGRAPALVAALRSARAGGVAVGALREALLQVIPYAGFPRGLHGLEALAGVAPAARPAAGEPLPGGASRRRAIRRRGLALFRRVYGGQAGGVLRRIGALHPDVADWIVEDAYGRVLARPGLSPGERECLAVALLAALDARPQLVAHVRGAFRCGATGAEVAVAAEAARGVAPAAAVSLALRRVAAEAAAAGARGTGERGDAATSCPGREGPATGRPRRGGRRPPPPGAGPRRRAGATARAPGA